MLQVRSREQQQGHGECVRVSGRVITAEDDDDYYYDIITIVVWPHSSVRAESCPECKEYLFGIFSKLLTFHRQHKGELRMKNEAQCQEMCLLPLETKIRINILIFFAFCLFLRWF